MLTIEALRELGVDTETGVARCINNEEFYLKMVGMALEDGGVEKLEAALAGGDLNAAFEAAHSLKGVMSNLSLEPVLRPVLEMTELLRARTETDYTPLLSEVKEAYGQLKALCAEE